MLLLSKESYLVEALGYRLYHSLPFSFEQRPVCQRAFDALTFAAFTFVGALFKLRV